MPSLDLTWELIAVIVFTMGAYILNVPAEPPPSEEDDNQNPWRYS